MTKHERSPVEQLACTGDATAFASIIRDLDRGLRGLVWSVVQSPHATEDVVQTVYEKAFRSIRGFDGRSSMKTWLHSIAYRAAIDHVRYEKHRRHEDIDSVEFGADASRVAVTGGTDAVDDRLDLDERLGELHPEQRALLMLTVGLGYSFDETAEIVGLKRGTVASKVSRARRQLKKEAQQ